MIHRRGIDAARHLCESKLERLERLRAGAEAALRLVHAGVSVEVDAWRLRDGTVHVRQGDLPAVRRVLGKLLPNTKTPSGERTVRVTLRVEGREFVRVAFDMPLPPGGKCRIVEQTTTYRTLVCDTSAGGKAVAA